MNFEKNQDQTDPQVRFLARGMGYNLFLTPAEAVLVLRKSPRMTPKARQATGPGLPAGAFNLRPFSDPPEIVRMRLMGGNRLCRMEGEGKLVARSNYFIGKGPGKWIQGVKQYTRVRMTDVYPGIDMIYYGGLPSSGAGRRGLEYDFVVKPGADPSRIRLQFESPRGIQIAREGGLRIKSAGGNLEFKPPVVYQGRGPQKRLVQGQFKMAGRNEVGFEVGDYDRTQPLVIDPILYYSTYLGGSTGSGDSGNSIAVDGSGNAYVTGYTQSANFPTTPGVYQPAFGTGASWNVFVTKVNPSGTALVYSTYLGDTIDLGYGIAVDSSGDAYVTGLTSSLNFPTTAGAYQTANPNGNCGFLSKLNPSGNTLLYSTYLGGNIGEQGNGVAVDGSGNAYVVGTTYSFNSLTKAGAFQFGDPGPSAATHAFVAKLIPAGGGASDLAYCTYLGGSKDDAGLGIAVDGASDAYVTGWTQSSNFPTKNPIQAAYGGNSGPVTSMSGGDAYVTKFNPSGSALLYSTFLGGSNLDSGTAIAVDGAGNAYVTGYTFSTDFPVTGGAYQTSYGAGTGDAFITKVNPGGTAWTYSTYLGGNFNSFGYGIAVDSSGDAYVTGFTNSTSFPTTPDAFQKTFLASNATPLFVTELNGAGTGLVYSTFLGGSGGDQGTGIAVDGAGNFYVTGFTDSTDFPTTSGAFQTTAPNPYQSALVAKFLNATPTPTVSAPPPCQSGLTLPLNLFKPGAGQGPVTFGATLCDAGHCSIQIFNSAGEHIRTLVDIPDQMPGLFQVNWDGTNKYGDPVASGVYLIHFLEPAGVHQARLAVIR